MIKVICDGCQKEYNIADDQEGKSGTCTNCGRLLQVQSNELKEKHIISPWYIIIPTSFLGFAGFYQISSYITFLVYGALLSVGIFIFLSSLYWLYTEFKKNGTMGLIKTIGKIFGIGVLCSPVLSIILLTLAFGSDSAGSPQSFWIKDKGQCNIVQTTSLGMYSNNAPWYKQTCKANDIIDKVTLEAFMFHQCLQITLGKEEGNASWRSNLQGLSRQEQDLFCKIIIPKKLGFMPYKVSAASELYGLFPEIQDRASRDTDNRIYQDTQYKDYAKEWFEYSQCSDLHSSQDSKDLTIKKILTISAMYGSYIQFEGLDTFLTGIHTLNQSGYQSIANEIVNERSQYKIYTTQLNKISNNYRTTFQCSKIKSPLKASTGTWKNVNGTMMYQE